MPTKAKPRTREQAIQERWQELDWQQRMAAQRQAEQTEREQEHEAFARRVQASRAAHAGVVHRLQMQVEDGKLTAEQAAEIQRQANDEVFAEARAQLQDGWTNYYRDLRAQEQAAAEEAERQRRAARTPRERWLMFLTPGQRAYVGKWEAINHEEWPMQIPVSE